jgi:hypothetical protein
MASTGPSHWQTWLLDDQGKKVRLLDEEWLDGRKWLITRPDTNSDYGHNGSLNWCYRKGLNKLYEEDSTRDDEPRPEALDAFTTFRQASKGNPSWFDETKQEAVNGRTCRHFIEYTVEYKTHFWVDAQTKQLIQVGTERPTATGWHITELVEYVDGAARTWDPPSRTAMTINLDDVRTRNQPNFDPPFRRSVIGPNEYLVTKLERDSLGQCFLSVLEHNISPHPPAVQPEPKYTLYSGSTAIPSVGLAGTRDKRGTDFWFPESAGLKGPFTLKIEKAKNDFASVSLGQPFDDCQFYPDTLCDVGEPYLQDLTILRETAVREETLQAYGVQMAPERGSDALFGSPAPNDHISQRYQAFMKVFGTAMSYGATLREAGGEADGPGVALVNLYHMQKLVGLNEDARKTLRIAWPIVEASFENRAHNDGYTMVCEAIAAEGMQGELHAYR